jgi:indolepyruvate ferredoxin oxidoreductase beta subunit
MKLDVVLAGLGGQGALTMATVLVRAAIREGYDAHFLAQSGLAQLGSTVIAHVRIGLPAGPSPKIPRGQADVAVALERLEALSLLRYLAPTAQVLVSREAVRPYGARFLRELYPEPEEVETAFAPRRVLWVPAQGLARRDGSPVLVSSVMLGAFAASNPVIDRDNLVLCLREVLPHLGDVEVEAFFSGYNHVAGSDA